MAEETQQAGAGRKIRCTAKADMLQPRVASSAPIRMHLIDGPPPAPAEHLYTRTGTDLEEGKEGPETEGGRAQAAHSCSNGRKHRCVEGQVDSTGVPSAPTDSCIPSCTPTGACTTMGDSHGQARDTATAGAAPDCGCGRQHLVRGATYQYCTCGLSEKQPLCDGSCAGTTFQPTPFCLQLQQKNALLCACKRTQDPPFCDGSHIHITWDDLQW